MTMPDERSRALRFAREILREMPTRDDVPEDLKRQARVTLRHYPDRLQLSLMIMVMAQANDDLGPPLLLPEASANTCHLAPLQTVSDDGDTENERSAQVHEDVNDNFFSGPTETILLSEQDFIRFAEIIENPPPPNENLIRAVARSKELFGQQLPEDEKPKT